MNAAVHILADLALADPVTEPEQEQQRQLANELARTRTQRASLEHELHEVESELQELAPQRERHHLVVQRLLRLAFRDAHECLLACVRTRSSRWIISSRPR